MTTESFLAWLDRLRRQRGLSWRGLAREAKIGHGTFDNYRRNPDALPELPTLLRLAEWSGEPLEDIQRRLAIQPSAAPHIQSVFRQRADRIVRRKPRLRTLVNELLTASDLTPDTISSILDNLEQQVGLRG